MAGAAGYLLKQVGSIRPGRRCRGWPRESRSSTRPSPSGCSTAAAGAGGGAAARRLTPQERRILDLIAQGKTNRQIAEEMFLAEKTVKNYVSNMLGKFGMQRRTQAATYAARLEERSSHETRSDSSGT